MNLFNLARKHLLLNEVNHAHDVRAREHGHHDSHHRQSDDPESMA